MNKAWRVFESFEVCGVFAFAFHAVAALISVTDLSMSMNGTATESTVAMDQGFTISLFTAIGILLLLVIIHEEIPD